MQNAEWLALLLKMAPEYHDQLILVTGIGSEISVQNLLRIEELYVVIRGRMSGTTDTGRIFLVPYSNLVCVGFQRELTDAQVAAALQESAESIAKAPAKKPADEAAVEAILEPPPLPVPPPISELPRPIDRKPASLKETLLQRLRARRADNVPGDKAEGHK